MIPVKGKKPEIVKLSKGVVVKGTKHKPDWRERVREIVYPVWFDGSSYIFDADGKMLFQIRGWGGLTSSGISDEDAHAIQCQWAETLVKALNEQEIANEQRSE